MPDIISRKAAKAAGLRHYFTGKPCARGHVALRFVSSWNCAQCLADDGARRKAENKENEKRYQKEYRNKNREVLKEYFRQYYLDRRAEKIAFQKQHYQKTREYQLRQHKKYYRENKHVYSAARNRRRALTKNCAEHHTAQDVKNILSRQRHKCANCKASLRKAYHVDHIMPLSKGGGNGRDNIQCLCPKCNLSKSAKHPIDWAQENGRLL